MLAPTALKSGDILLDGVYQRFVLTPLESRKF